jgi:hypothetical protein
MSMRVDQPGKHSFSPQIDHASSAPSKGARFHVGSRKNDLSVSDGERGREWASRINRVNASIYKNEIHRSASRGSRSCLRTSARR